MVARIVAYLVDEHLKGEWLKLALASYEILGNTVGFPCSDLMEGAVGSVLISVERCVLLRVDVAVCNEVLIRAVGGGLRASGIQIARENNGEWG